VSTTRPDKPEHLSVLLVDDQPIVAHGVRALLADQKDIELHYCQNPRKAFEMAQQVHAEVILQDLTMPEIDGITLVRFFRNHPATRILPIIILSSKESPRDKAEAFRAAANDYLVKLPDRQELVARIRLHRAGLQRLRDSQTELAGLRKQVEEMAQQLESLHQQLRAAPDTARVPGPDAETMQRMLEHLGRMRQFQDQLTGTPLNEVQKFCVRQFGETVARLDELLESRLPQPRPQPDSPPPITAQIDRHGQEFQTIRSSSSGMQRAPHIPELESDAPDQPS
jgi:DNA-binding response OmpR family regulator